MTGVSYVIPLRNGAASIDATLDSIVVQADGRPMEVIVVDDGSTDDGVDRIGSVARHQAVRVLEGPCRGAAAALNVGIRAARFPIVCQVDQDVVLQPGWMQHLVDDLADERVGATQGYFIADRRAPLFARVMGFDLEHRYASIGERTDHVCTGNAAYRVDALSRVGLFDETLGYGYDNDMSYRLTAAGYRLSFCREARSLHRWREGLRGYLVQQYGFGYGRLDLVAKHPERLSGDMVSPRLMMWHPWLLLCALGLMCAAVFLTGSGVQTEVSALIAASLLGFLLIERTAAGLFAARRFRSWAPLLFPIVHVARDLAWVAAILVWSLRHVGGRQRSPSHSMRPRPHTPVAPGRAIVGAETMGVSSRILVLIPAHNEAATLPSVVRELRTCRPDLDVLVVDDGSVDETPGLLDHLGVRWIRLPERMGIGGAVRAGLRYAVRLGFDTVVRFDADGQHRPEEIERLLRPILARRAEVVLGTRYSDRQTNAAGGRWYIRRSLAACLTAITGRRVTDPTSGSYALGRYAVRILSEHHPTGYPEPELQLFLSRNGLRVVEVPVAMRSRGGGRTSLTPSRVLVASARVLLAMVIVPLRHAVGVSVD